MGLWNILIYKSSEMQYISWILTPSLSMEMKVPVFWTVASQAGNPLPSLRQMRLIRHWTRRRRERSHPPPLLFSLLHCIRRGHLNHAPVHHRRRPWQFSSRCASHDAMIQQFAAMMETMFVSLFWTRSLLFLGMCICLTFLRILITSAHLGVTSSSHCHFDYARTHLASNAGRRMGRAICVSTFPSCRR